MFVHIFDSGHHAIHLAEPHHATMETITGIVALILIAQDGSTMIDTHRNVWIELFKNAAHLNEVGTTVQVVGLNKISIGKDICRSSERCACFGAQIC